MNRFFRLLTDFAFFFFFENLVFTKKLVRELLRNYCSYSRENCPF